jgi:hypothetical protein
MDSVSLLKNTIISDNESFKSSPVDWDSSTNLVISRPFHILDLKSS